ncbi:MAG: aminopeptidase P family protein [Bacteroidales bacterium]|jgi:Xaa-Pro aminopeptidase|nr:aminopeptidase P family protein [Bacteroidales bacterium]
MFSSNVYIARRNRLRSLVSSGIILFPGNPEAAMNYAANTYHYRQDSNFLYYFGLDHDGFAGVIDVDNNKDIIFGNDIDMDDIIWMGFQPSVKEQAARAGVEHTEPMTGLETFIKDALAKGRKVHIVKPYRGKVLIWLESLLGVHHSQVKDFVSEELIRAIVTMRSVKEDIEIREIERAVDVAYIMHTTGMKMAKPGVVEQEIAGVIEGIALSHGGPVSFPVILSIDGQTLHNHYHGNILKEGRMMVIDAGCESALHYASDITRTVPVGGQFNQRQKEIYEIVLKANMETIKATRPGIYYKEMHLLAAKTIATGLKELGLMKGDVDEAVSQGAHALFFPHGLGHMLGLDVHDMEGLGENFVGYDSTIARSSQFGLAFLRFGRKLEPGFVLTNEPGCYFIPALIDQWRAEGRFTEFINYDKVETYKDFGGIRIEDDVLVTADGNRVLGKPIPKTVDEVEKLCGF